MSRVRAPRRRLIIWLAALALALAVAAVACPLLSDLGYLRSRPLVGDRWVCATNLRQLALGLLVYGEELNGGRLPSPGEGSAADSWVKAVRRSHYLQKLDEITLFCPSDRDRRGITSYTMPPSAKGLNINALRNPAETIILTEKRAFHDGRRLAAFADGSVHMVSGLDAERHSAGL